MTRTFIPTHDICPALNHCAATLQDSAISFHIKEARRRKDGRLFTVYMPISVVIVVDASVSVIVAPGRPHTVGACFVAAKTTSMLMSVEAFILFVV